MFDGAPSLLSADELRQKFQQAGLHCVATHFNNPKQVILLCSWQERKQEFFHKYKNEKQSKNTDNLTFKIF
jgi:hypothetical protein